MTLQFGSGGGAPSFATAPVAGTPSIAIGTGTFAGGAAPDFQGTSVIGVNMAAGYASNLLSAQIAGVTQFAVSSSGATTIGASGNGTITAGVLAPSNAGLPQLNFTAQSYFRLFGRAAGNLVLAIDGFSLQTADIVNIRDSGAVNHLGVMNAGTGGAPIWALRVAPVANAASMAQAHVGGASTGKAIQVIDNAGTTIGWLQLLA